MIGKTTPAQPQRAFSNVPDSINDIVLTQLPRSIMWATLLAVLFMLSYPDYEALFSAFVNPAASVLVEDSTPSYASDLIVYFLCLTILFLSVTWLSACSWALAGRIEADRRRWHGENQPIKREDR